MLAQTTRLLTPYPNRKTHNAAARATDAQQPTVFVTKAVNVGEPAGDFSLGLPDEQFQGDARGRVERVNQATDDAARQGRDNHRPADMRYPVIGDQKPAGWTGDKTPQLKYGRVIELHLNGQKVGYASPDLLCDPLYLKTTRDGEDHYQPIAHMVFKERSDGGITPKGYLPVDDKYKDMIEQKDLYTGSTQGLIRRKDDNWLIPHRSDVVVSLPDALRNNDPQAGPDDGFPDLPAHDDDDSSSTSSERAGDTAAPVRRDGEVRAACLQHPPSPFVVTLGVGSVAVTLALAGFAIYFGLGKLTRPTNTTPASALDEFQTMLKGAITDCAQEAGLTLNDWDRRLIDDYAEALRDAFGQRLSSSITIVKQQLTCPELPDNPSDIITAIDTSFRTQLQDLVKLLASKAASPAAISSPSVCLVIVSLLALLTELGLI